ncbi:MAG: SEC-C metal-binding domain-containing protein, partial [Acidobacteria bacterium]|nr:SEC-C metal-binding domain-containing protein [Acidobacteriota bacterium]
LGEHLFEALKERYEAKEQFIGEEPMRYHERMIMLSVLDGLWKDHLLNMDHLKEGIGLRGYGQQDPLVEYKRESFDMFEAMMNRFQEDTVRYLYLMQIVGPDGKPLEIPKRVQREAEPMTLSGGGAPVRHVSHDGMTAVAEQAASTVTIPTRQPTTTIDDIEREFERKKKRELDQARMAGVADGGESVATRRVGEKVGRNDPCPCGSGKKYKKCHGADA